MQRWYEPSFELVLNEHRRRFEATGTEEGTVMAAVLAYPLLLSSYQMDVARDALIFALLALSLDFLWGKAGVLSFGQAAFFGMGAYAVAIVGPMVPTTMAHWPGWSPASGAG